MKKVLFQFTTIAIIMLLAACSNDEIITEQDKGSAQETKRTLSLTASMPGEKSDVPNTRVGLQQQLDNSIELTWEVGDKLQLAFVQGTIKVKQTIILTTENITNEGKKAVFDIELPESSTGFNDNANFDLYGVCGGGKRKIGVDLNLPGNGEAEGGGNATLYFDGDALELGDESTNPYVQLPSYTGGAQSLENVHFRKDVMLTFTSKDIDVNKPQISVAFEHLGSLFSISLKNSGTTNLENLNEAQLVGINNPDNQNWAYNAGAGGKTYDLVAGKFLDTESGGNFISMKAAANTLEAGATTTFWAWYPPLPNKVWPELQLQLKDGTKPDALTLAIGADSKPERTAAIPAGRTYYFYAAWDGAELNFTTDPNLFTVLEMGTLGTMLTAEQKQNITKLRLKGQINKADFEVMKRQMPLLTFIDLSEVTCEDNKIPDEAFGDNDYSSNTIISKIILPNSITAIGEYAFKECTGLTGSLVIPDEVTTIGDLAFFECAGLTGSLFIPNKVTKIGLQAFQGCSGFTGSLHLSEELTTMGWLVFSGCSGFTGSLTIPDKLTTIEVGTFSGCSGFTGSLIIPDNVTAINWEAFTDCSGFTGSLHLPKELTKIAGFAFDRCSGFTGSLTIPDSVTTIQMRAFSGCSGFTGSLTIPENVTSIGGSAFSSCHGFTGSLTIPNSVTSIGESAFSSCAGFTGSLTIPANVTTIEGSAFYGCSGLTGTLIIPNDVTTIGDYAFGYCTGFTGSLTIPDNITTIGENAFYGCSGFTGSLVLSSELTEIKRAAFADCPGFTGTLNLPAKLTSIEGYAFQNCSSFTGLLTIPDNVTSIGNGAFGYCSGFTGSLTIPATVTTIGDKAFDGCTEITAFQFPHSNLFPYSTEMLPSGKTVKVPEALVPTYIADNSWNSRHEGNIVKIE